VGRLIRAGLAGREAAGHAQTLIRANIIPPPLTMIVSRQCTAAEQAVVRRAVGVCVLGGGGTC
jgi:hypothetical protein